MFFDQSSGIFRTGAVVNSNAWSPANSGNYSFGAGYNSLARGTGSFVGGVNNQANGDKATSFGEANIANGYGAAAIGVGLESISTCNLAIGKWNVGGGNPTTWIGTDPLFEIGNGTSFAEKSNALTVLKNGDMILGPSRLPENGTSSNEKMFFFSKENGAVRTGLSQSERWSPDSIGFFSFASGNGNLAYGYGSGAFGSGSRAYGSNSFVAGNNAQSLSPKSIALGGNTIAKAFSSIAIGAFNLGLGSTTGWFDTDPILEVGIGQDGNSRKNALTILKNGNVGIGDNDPGEKLTMNGKIRLTEASGEFNYLDIGRESGNHEFRAHGSGDMSFTHEGVQILTLTQLLDVGIGTETPDQKLSVIGTARAAFEEAESNYIEFGHGGNNAFINADGTGNIDLRHHNANIMTLSSDLKVGIRTNNPTSDLHIRHSNSGASGGLQLENTTSGDHARFYVASSDGNLRIYSDNQAGAIGFFDDASGVYTANSDFRLKENFEDLHFDWASFMEFRPLVYKFRSDESHRRHIGMVAQEVQNIYPELVNYDSSEDTYHMDYAAIGVIAVRAIQQLRDEKEALENEVARQQSEIDQLRKKSTEAAARISEIHALLVKALGDK